MCIYCYQTTCFIDYTNCNESLLYTRVAQNSSKIRRGPVSPKRNDRRRGENAKRERKSGVKGGRRRDTKSTREDRPGPPPAPTSHVMTPCGYFAREPNRKDRARKRDTYRAANFNRDTIVLRLRSILTRTNKDQSRKLIFNAVNRPEEGGERKTQLLCSLFYVIVFLFFVFKNNEYSF